MRGIGFKRALSKCTLNRLRKRDIVFKDAPNKCALDRLRMRVRRVQTTLSRSVLKSIALPCACFVKELRQKILQSVARKIFCALDNNDKLKSKHARSGALPRALITSLPTDTSEDYFSHRHSAGHLTIGDGAKLFNFLTFLPRPQLLNLSSPKRHSYSKSEGDIWMKSKEKPSRTRGAYLSYVTRRAGGL